MPVGHGKNHDLLFLKSKKAISGRKKAIFRSYSIIKNLEIQEFPKNWHLWL